MGMRSSDDGSLAPEAGYLTERIKELPEINRTEMPEYSTSLKAIIFELYGTGNGPSRRQTLLDAIKAAHDKGIVVVALSQCLRGGVSLETYSMGAEFHKRGVISGGDMTTEACTTKL
eukprot:gene40820-50512_t